MNKVIGWRVWYSDGTHRDSKTSRWDAIPNDDVQIVVLYHEGGNRRFMQGNDYYWRWEDGPNVIYGHADSFDPRRYPGAVVLRGKWTSDENITRLIEEAMNSMVL